MRPARNINQTVGASEASGASNRGSQISNPESPDSARLYHASSASMGAMDARYHRLRQCIEELKAALPRDTQGSGDLPDGELDRAYKIYERTRVLSLDLIRVWMKGWAESPALHAREVGSRTTEPVRDTTRARLSGVFGAEHKMEVGSRSFNGGHVRTASSGSMTTPVDMHNSAAVVWEPMLDDRADQMIRSANVAWCDAIREWKACVESLGLAYRWYLVNTHRDSEPDAARRMVESFVADQGGRKQGVKWIGSVQLSKRKSSISNSRENTEEPLRIHKKLAEDLREIDELLRTAKRLIRPVHTVVIAPRGDTVLQFAKQPADGAQAILRFRVSSHMLAETSPFFRQMFSANEDGTSTPQGGRDSDYPDTLPPPRTEMIVLQDATSATLYHMPQYEANKESSLTILLHAAHMHNSRVPREVTFPQFVAIAETALRYRCTAPLELAVEHRWLPEWLHKVTEPMPDGLLLISYVFGPRWLFTRMTKTAIMNIVDEEELESKNWPRQVKDRIWAMRCAKMEQLYNCVSGVIEEYLPRPAVPENDTTDGPEVGTETTAIAVVGEEGWDDNVPATSTSAAGAEEGTRTYSIFSTAMSTITSVTGTGSAPNTTSTTTTTSGAALSTSPPPEPVKSPKRSFERVSTPLVPTNTPRCPKGSHWCDATNLGWVFLMLNELRLLGTVLYPNGPLVSRPSPSSALDGGGVEKLGSSAVPGGAAPLPPARSFASLADELRSVSSPPHPVHPPTGNQASSLCDPAPALRRAVNDVYNSVLGVELHDVRAGRWGLSLHGREGRVKRRETLMDEEDGDADEDGENVGAWSDSAVESRPASWTGIGPSATPPAAGVDTATEIFVDATEEQGATEEEDESSVGEPTEATTSVEGHDDEASPSEAGSSLPGHIPSGGRDEDREPPDEGEMTVEEAQRILWPDAYEDDSGGASTRPRGHCRATAGPVTSIAETVTAAAPHPQIESEVHVHKFLTSEVSVVEDKVLVVTTQKQLRVDYERRVGLI